MAELDFGISKFQPVNALAAYQQGYQAPIQQAAQNNQANMQNLQMAEGLQQFRKQNAIRDLAQQAGNDPSKFYSQAAMIDPAYIPQAQQFQQAQLAKQLAFKAQADKIFYQQGAAGADTVTKMAASYGVDPTSVLQPYLQLPDDKAVKDYALKSLPAADYKNILQGDSFANKEINPFPDADRNMWINQGGKPQPVIDPRTGKQMKGPVPTGQYVPPSSQIETTAQAIANGQLAPLSGFALKSPGAQAIMTRVLQINPQFDANNFAVAKSTETDFAKGKSGQQIKSFNVGLNHLDTLGGLIDSLDNGNTQLFNKLGNAWNAQTGSPAPTNFESTKKIVTDEIVKAIVGAGGGVQDREEASKTISSANSPAQLRGVINQYKELMVGQLNGLEQQYKSGTGKDDFQTKYLTDKSRSLYASHNQPQNLSQADIDAVNWAKSNPNDPRSAQILSLHGIK